MRVQKQIELPRIHNNFVVKVKDSKSGTILQEAKAENVVLDVLYHYLMQRKHLGGPNRLYYGSGSGTPAVSDTGLFTSEGYGNVTGLSTDVTENLVTYSGKIVLDETTANGVTITELALNYYRVISYDTYTTYFNHAMLTDSEGTPISIGPKTETQIIEIFFTLYVEKGTSLSAFPNEFSKSLTSATYSRNRFISKILPTNLIADGTIDYNSATQVKTSTDGRVAAADGNSVILFPTCDIRALEIESVSEKIIFPNLSVFPLFSFSERQIGTGDGVTKWFNFPNGFFVDGSEVIKVDGVTKVSGVDYYTHQGARNAINYTDLGNPYGSKIETTLYLSDSSKAFGSNLGVYNPRATTLAYSSYYILDLGSVQNIGAIGLSVGGNYSDTPYYSADGLSWTACTVSQTASKKRLYSDLQEESIRYIWISTGWAESYGVYFALIYGLPSIEFVTAPADTLEITGSWDTGVPPKNANIFYDISWALTGVW